MCDYFSADFGSSLGFSSAEGLEVLAEQGQLQWRQPAGRLRGARESLGKPASKPHREW